MEDLKVSSGSTLRVIVDSTPPRNVFGLELSDRNHFEGGSLAPEGWQLNLVPNNVIIVWVTIRFLPKTEVWVKKRMLATHFQLLALMSLLSFSFAACCFVFFKAEVVEWLRSEGMDIQCV